jgi:hypothetical protein
MKIKFILFHRQLGGLLHPATGKFSLVIRKIGVTGQLPRFHFLPGAAVPAPGLVPAGHYSHLGQWLPPDLSSRARESRRIVLPSRALSGGNQNNPGDKASIAKSLCLEEQNHSAGVLPKLLAYFAAFGEGDLHPIALRSPGFSWSQQK